MVSVLAGIPGLAIYLDEVVIYGSTASIHDELSLNTQKCVFPVPAIDGVVFQLSAGGITSFQSKVDTIQAFPDPGLAAQVASLFPIWHDVPST